MPKRTLALTAASAALLVLTGCGSMNGAAETASPTSAATAEPAAVKSPEPLVAEVTAAAADGPEAAYLAEVRRLLKETTQIPGATDEQLLEAGLEACDQLAAGVDVLDVRLIDGEVPDQLGYYADTLVMVGAAQQELCPSGD